MSFTRDPHGRALLGGVSLASLLSDVPTPFYAYDVDAMVDAATSLASGFRGRDHLVCYAVKANSAGRILRRLAAAGIGADVVSGGELEVALASGISPEKIVWSGVAKTNAEIDRGISAGDHGILSIHVESIEELRRVDARASALGRKARVSLRVNPGVEADTHQHIATGHDEAKFGIFASDVPQALDLAARSAHLELVGLSSHIGSQMISTEPFANAVAKLCDLAIAWRAKGHALHFLDVGGGFGIDYGDGRVTPPADFARVATKIVDEKGLGDLRLLSEPGRAIVASFGVIVAKVIGEKRWSREGSVGWLFLDAGMNDLVRPALYGARHRIEPLALRSGGLASWRVAGPVCESSDDFGTFLLPDPPPDAVVIRDAGAYGYAMASAYNGRGLPRETFLEGGAATYVSATAGVDEWISRRIAT